MLKRFDKSAMRHICDVQILPKTKFELVSRKRGNLPLMFGLRP